MSLYLVRNDGRYDPRALGARCDLCPLKGATPVPPSPSATDRPRFVIVGEAPGRLEVLKGAPFIGPSGKLLDRILREAGLDRDDAHVTNAMACRPEDDRPDVKLAATSCCAPRLAAELTALPRGEDRPRIRPRSTPRTAGNMLPVLPFGQWGSRAILGTRSILKARGFVWQAPLVQPEKIAAQKKALVRMRENARREHKLDKRREGIRKKERALLLLQAQATYAGAWAVPTLHPAFILRGADGWLPVLIGDVKRFRRLLDGKLKLEDLGPYSVASTPAEVKEQVGALGEIHPGSFDLSFDIETTGKEATTTSLKCLSISDGKRTVVVHPWENRLMFSLRAALKGRTLVMHNGPQFDHIVMRRYGMPIPKWEDTLIAHHVFAGHLPKSLAHVVSVYCDARPWKLLAGKDAGGEKGIGPWEYAEKAPPAKKKEAIKNLLDYSAADARLTALAWGRMGADLEPELRVYESDKIMALLCQRMTETGIATDEKKRRELSVILRNRKRALLGEMRKLIQTKNFHPARLKDVRWALFTRFKAPLLRPTATGLASTSNETLEYLKGRGADTRAGRMANLILRWREAAKVLSTYVEGEHRAEVDGRVHAPWKLGPVTGRLAGPLMTLPRYGKDPVQQVRGLYIARRYPKPRIVAQVHDAAIIEAFGTFVYYDLSQAEARLAAYFSGDEALIAACEADIHTENAKIVFQDSPEAVEALVRANELPLHVEKNGKALKWKAVSKDKGGCKEYRDIAKNVGFCVWYCGTAERAFITLRAQGFQVTMAACEEIVRRFHATYDRYYDYVAENVQYVRRHGHLRTVFLGRIRWLGWHAKETEISNFPIQSGIADLQNERLPRIEGKLTDCASVEEVKGLVKSTWNEPIEVPHNGKRFVMPTDVKEGVNWGEAFG